MKKNNPVWILVIVAILLIMVFSKEKGFLGAIVDQPLPLTQTVGTHTFTCTVVMGGTENATMQDSDWADRTILAVNANNQLEVSEVSNNNMALEFTGAQEGSCTGDCPPDKTLQTEIICTSPLNLDGVETATLGITGSMQTTGDYPEMVEFDALGFHKQVLNTGVINIQDVVLSKATGDWVATMGDEYTTLSQAPTNFIIRMFGKFNQGNVMGQFAATSFTITCEDGYELSNDLCISSALMPPTYEDLVAMTPSYKGGTITRSELGSVIMLWANS